jgi:hypothetical protein
MSSLEKQVEISRIRHNILEYKLKREKKAEEIKRIDEAILKFEETLKSKEGVE